MSHSSQKEKIAFCCSGSEPTYKHVKKKNYETSWTIFSKNQKLCPMTPCSEYNLENLLVQKRIERHVIDGRWRNLCNNCSSKISPVNDCFYAFSVLLASHATITSMKCRNWKLFFHKYGYTWLRYIKSHRRKFLSL